MSEETKEVVQPTLDELITMRTEQLAQVDSSIITSQRLIQGGVIKVVDGRTEEGTDPITLTVSGAEMVQSMLSPTLNKLLKDRGSISFDLDRYKAAKEKQTAE